MASLDKSRFVENANRAVFVSREINDDLISDLAPTIMALREAGRTPICLYIDSAGGSVFYAQRLLALLKSPRQDGHVPWIISVCMGFAASAAADLLALGDYAIAYPFGVIHHHGTRQSEQTITVENIGKIESTLRETNEDFAIRLATKIFHRLIPRIVQIRQEKTPNFLFHETIADPQTFIGALCDKVSEKHRDLINAAGSRQKDVIEILKLSGVKPDTVDPPPESQVLKAIIDYECKKTGLTNKQFLSATDLSTIRDNFYQIRGLYHDRYWINLMEIVQLKGEFFLQPDETKKFQEIPKDHEEERVNFLMSCVAHKLNPIWWFVVSLSRCLQSGEHTLKAVDAYWLGLVDEVGGSDLPCVRDAYEKLAQLPSSDSESPPSTKEN